VLSRIGPDGQIVLLEDQDRRLSGRRLIAEGLALIDKAMRHARPGPSPVVTLNRAVAVSRLRGPAAALAMVEPLAPCLAGYFHFWGVKGALLLQLGHTAEARAAFDRAIALAGSTAAAAHIRQHLDRLLEDGTT
jgi:RNA polymerase sigma-70 factor (ECF subfamily)